MMKVGITGGVGTGKSTVCRIFALYDIPTFYSDDEAKRLMATDPQVREHIIKLLGHQAYADGVLDRAYVAQRIYADDTLKQELEKIVHPAVQRASQKWNAQQAQEKVPYTLKEAAIMVESGTHTALDKLIVVSSPKPLRIQRLLKYRSYSTEKIDAIMSAQLSDEQLAEYADFTIFNNQTDSLILQVAQTHQKLLTLSCNY